MFRKRFAVKQRLKRDFVVEAVLERARVRSLGLLVRVFTDAELAALEPYSSTFHLEESYSSTFHNMGGPDSLEDMVYALMEEEEGARRVAWLEDNIGRYCGVDCKKEW